MESPCTANGNTAMSEVSALTALDPHAGVRAVEKTATATRTTARAKARRADQRDDSGRGTAVALKAGDVAVASGAGSATGESDAEGAAVGVVAAAPVDNTRESLAVVVSARICAMSEVTSASTGIPN